MAKSNVFRNWKGVTYQTSGGTSTPITQVKDIQETNNEGIEGWRADGNIFPTIMSRQTADVGLTIVGGDIATFLAIPRGVPLTITAVLYDAINGAGSGALTHVWSNAVVADIPASGPSNSFAGGSISFMCYSIDGTTNPLAVTQAT